MMLEDLTEFMKSQNRNLNAHIVPYAMIDLIENIHLPMRSSGHLKQY